MDFYASTTDLVVDGAANFTTAALVILGVVLGIGVGILVFKWGWRKVRGSAR